MRLTPHFGLAEFCCEAGAQYPRVWLDRAMRLAVALERIRETFDGAPIKITSGFRTDAGNAAAGGAQHSPHKQGRAVDWRFADCDNERVHEALKFIERRHAALGVFGLGWYPVNDERPRARIHIDVRLAPTLARWTKETGP